MSKLTVRNARFGLWSDTYACIVAAPDDHEDASWFALLVALRLLGRGRASC